MAQRASNYNRHALEYFEEILAVDTTIVRVNDMLPDSFPGCSARVASAKLDIVMNGAYATPRRLKIAEGKQSDQGVLDRASRLGIR